MVGRPCSAAQWRAVACSVRVVAFTFAPCSRRYSHVSARSLMAAQCNAVMSSSSRSVVCARPDSIRARIDSVFPSLAAVKMLGCVHPSCKKGSRIQHGHENWLLRPESEGDSPRVR
jgi:hypothetical protein